MNPPAVAWAKAARCVGCGLFVLALACETDGDKREGSVEAVPSARRTAAAIVLAGRPKLVRLPPRVAALAEPSLLLLTNENPKTEPPIGSSRVGGLPDMPNGTVWPSPRGRPLAFLLQLDLAEVARHLPSSELPPRGMLYFFYDAEQAPWGYRPEDRGGFRVVHSIANATRLRRFQAPAGLKPPPFTVQSVDLRSDRSYPDPSSYSFGLLDLNPREREEYAGFLASVGDSRPSPHHRLLGHPEALTGDMQTDCQLVSNGVDISNASDPRRRSLVAGSAEWRLLLQLDASNEAHLEWADAGRLFFFIRRDDLQKANFDAVWLIVQGD